MQDYLIDHAIKNVWCSPPQDKQAIIQPVRLSADGGVWNFFDIGYNRIDLPDKTSRFHVYQVGQLHPYLLGLFPSYQSWKQVDENCNELSMICNIYDVSGLEYPRFQVWYMVTRSKNLIFAIKKPQNNVFPVNFYKPTIYIRVYSNEYFKSARSYGLTDKVHIHGQYIGNGTDIINLQTEFNSYATMPGHTYGLVNGFKVASISPLNVAIGDLVEYVYDGSIKAVYDFSIQNLKTFVSDLDQSRKYLLHYPGTTDIIDYEDDIDVFLYKSTYSGEHQGIYFHKNEEQALRNVTHKDYSVPVDLIQAFASYQSTWTNLNDLTLRLHIRNSGFDRPLFYEANRIHELYKLDDVSLVGAMLGIDSTLTQFKAQTLENSAYIELMRSKISDITLPMVESAYGFNAISQALADTPNDVYLSSEVKVVKLPYGLIDASTILEYDTNGTLLGFHNHTETASDLIVDQSATMVEAITGLSSNALDETYNQRTQVLDPNKSYKFYKCSMTSNLPNNDWQELPVDSGDFAIIDNTLTWLNDDQVWYTLVRSDAINLLYEIDLSVDRSLLNFSLTSLVTKNSTQATEPMSLPMGRLELFLNGNLLIEGLDFFVKFPNIVICNKAYLVDSENSPQKITVLFTGHCDSNLKYEKIWDTGFIDHGVLSNNNKFDLRDDKVLRINIGGKLFKKSDLLFKEEDSSVLAGSSLNGTPYRIRDIVPTISSFVSTDQKTLYEASLATDSAVSDYMTLKVPDPAFDTPNVIENYYRIYSPFFSRVMRDLLSGVINDTRLYEQYSSEVVKDILKDYEYLLDFDPTQEALTPDDRYVIIDAYELENIIDINIYQYKFLNKVIEVYLSNKIILSHLLRLVQFGT